MRTNSPLMILSEGIGLGAGLTYFLDPRSGRRRRAGIRKQAIHRSVKTGKFLESVRADLTERSHGLASKFRRLVRLDAQEEVDDKVLVDRVRAKLDKHVTHPGSLQVEAASGRVILAGPILAKEAGDAIRQARHVPGVRDVENRLEVHQDEDHVPGLQGQSRRSHEKPEILRQNWSPTTRLLAGGLGAWLVSYGIRRHGAARGLGIGIGLGMFSRSWLNRPLMRR